MSIDLYAMRDYTLARLQEPSTWRGLILVITGLGAAVNPDLREAIVTLGLFAAGLIGAALPDTRK